MICKRLTLAGIVSTILAFSSAAYATSLVKMDFDEMVQEASACVIAKAGNSVSVNENGAIVTHTTFTVEKTAFGSTPRTITVTTPGGRLVSGDFPVAEVNAGAPQFFDGQKNLLLLQDAPNDGYAIVGYSQGVFNVIETSDGASVSLPDTAGGVTAVDDAIAIVRGSRSRGPARALDDND